MWPRAESRQFLNIYSEGDCNNLSGFFYVIIRFLMCVHVYILYCPFIHRTILESYRDAKIIFLLFLFSLKSYCLEKDPLGACYCEASVLHHDT